MGNCLIWDKGNSVSPEEKLFKEMLDEMRERRMKLIREESPSKRKKKLKGSRTNKFYDDESFNIKSWENTTDTFFADSAETFFGSKGMVFPLTNVHTCDKFFRKGSMQSRSNSKNGSEVNEEDEDNYSNRNRRSIINNQSKRISRVKRSRSLDNFKFKIYKGNDLKHTEDFVRQSTNINVIRKL